jgi:hypothetical protein
VSPIRADEHVGQVVLLILDGEGKCVKSCVFTQIMTFDIHRHLIAPLKVDGQEPECSGLVLELVGGRLVLLHVADDDVVGGEPVPWHTSMGVQVPGPKVELVDDLRLERPIR